MKLDPTIIKENVRKLLAENGLNMRQAAEQAGITYKWLRRVSSRGLTRIESRNEEQLSALCELLGVDDPSMLFSELSPEVVSAIGIIRSLRQRFPVVFEKWLAYRKFDDVATAIQKVAGAVLKYDDAEYVRSRLEQSLGKESERIENQTANEVQERFDGVGTYFGGAFVMDD